MRSKLASIKNGPTVMSSEFQEERLEKGLYGISASRKGTLPSNSRGESGRLLMPAGRSLACEREEARKTRPLVPRDRKNTESGKPLIFYIG
ncbi:hypothetical protein CEXT_28231 [Caerostris extrusa]|uniref:Uncharacterized protein n=1 Tax=Caerostris extrusa TaxID=172846 RepID=A0AAV4TTW2_CAEEX|nr:hypothetical protein CEXT_28231 [Caerostris extrusa]